MYNLKIKNNYLYESTFRATASNKVNLIKPGTSISIKNLGNGILSVFGMGVVNFIDLAAKKIPGYDYPKEHWGVLIRTHTLEGYYRYEGGGELLLEINEYGSYSLSTENGTLITISLPELTIE